MLAAVDANRDDLNRVFAMLVPIEYKFGLEFVPILSHGKHITRTRVLVPSIVVYVHRERDCLGWIAEIGESYSRFDEQGKCAGVSDTHVMFVGGVSAHAYAAKCADKP